MGIKDILQIIYIVAAFIVGAVPAVIAFCQAAKARKNAKTEEEANEASNKMLEKANELIVQAETFYKGLDSALKAQGESAGAYKKESVMAKLQAYATEISAQFDVTYWSEKVDQIVALTKSVNTK